MTSYDMADPGPLMLRIAGEMNIYRADELKEMLADAQARSAVVEIDLSQVSEIDSAGVQLIVAARKQAVRIERDFRVVAHSPAVVEALELLDLATCLGIGGAACLGCENRNKCFAS